MKNLLEIAKIFVLALLVIIPAKVSAIDYESVPVTYLKDIVGNWYDTKGNLVLTISSDYKVNNCQVLYLGLYGESVAMYKIRINEGSNYRDIELLHSGSSYHEYIFVNWNSSNGYALRKTKNPQYFESVGGIYLGMDKSEVLKLYGQPSKIESYDRRQNWKYNNDLFEVNFDCNIVTEIKIYPYGTRKFDRTGISAKDDFKYILKKYNAKPMESVYTIGYGETIRKSYDGSGSISLGVEQH